MKEKLFRLLAITVALLIVLSAVPFTSLAASPGSVEEVFDNVFLDALEYTGYNVTAQRNDGSLFVKYSSSAPAAVRSNISYGTGPSGLETVVNYSTPSGLAPDIAAFERGGLCCASYVSYVYFNYLTNIEGIDTSYVSPPVNPRSAPSYYETAVQWINTGKARSISYTQNSNGSNFSPSESIPIGSLLVFRSISTGGINHVAIYAGYYNGTHFVTHVGNSRGPEICSVSALTKGNSPQVVALIAVPEYIEATGTIEILKTDPNGKNLAGAYFSATSVTDPTIQHLIGPTDANGYAATKQRLKYGDYIIRETVFPSGYTEGGLNEWRVTVNGNNQTVRLNIVNDYKYGSVKVTKTSEDSIVENILFRLTGTDIYGNAVNLTASTGQTGVAIFDKVPIGNNYTLTEINVPVKYVLPDVQNVSVAWNDVAETTVHNRVKKWQAEVYKTDKDGTVQGDGTLQGAVYGLYKDGKLVDSYTTDDNGYFLTKQYACDSVSDWYIQEISPSTGYLLDATVYPIETDAEEYTQKINTVKVYCTEQIIRGKITVTKHWGKADVETSLNPPEPDAQFQIFLKSAGSFEDAKSTERDTLITDENGYAETKPLPFGVYTVVQIKGKEGTEIMQPFDVHIKENGKVYGYIVNNAMLESLIEIVKKDAETGKIIPVAGVGFKVKNSMSGEFITQHINYPTPTDIDVFYTDETGKLMLPEKLPYGHYAVIEQCAADGYVLENKPQKFVVDGRNKTVVVEVNNSPQKGIIKISKTGERFSSVTKYNGRYTPFYTVEYLKGAEFEITAADDVVTPDGTVRYSKGQVVARVTTGEDGKAESPALYLGRYIVRETKAPDGMIMDTEPKEVELKYAGQDIELTEISCSFFNERRKIKLSLKKELEKSNRYDVGGAEQYKNVQFALYAAEDIFAADGSYIPKDGLIEIAVSDGEGNIAFGADMPAGSKCYVMEYFTDKHYQISDIVYPVTFDFGESTDKEVGITVNSGEKIKNKLLKGSVVGKKTDENGNPLSGVTFGIFALTTTELTEKTALALAVTGEDGMFSFEEVPYGSWFVKELKAAAGYQISNKIYEVNITDEGCVVELTVINRKNDVSESPKTGDTSYPILAGIVLALSSVAVIFGFKKLTKRKVNE